MTFVKTDGVLPILLLYWCSCIAGGGVLGGVDNISRIQEVCHSHDVWLHVEGHNLAAVALPNSPNMVCSPLLDDIYKFLKYLSFDRIKWFG